MLDLEMLQMFAESFQPVAADDAALGFDAIAEVAPGGHFFGARHTLSRYQSAFYEPLVSDWRNYGQWSEDGSRTARQRALGIWQRVLAEFEAPSLPAGAEEALHSFIVRRSAEGGALP